MKKLTSAVCGLALSLAVAGISFAQTPAPSPNAPAANGGSAATTPAKKHSKKKTNKKAAATTSSTTSTPSKQ